MNHLTDIARYSALFAALSLSAVFHTAPAVAQTTWPACTGSAPGGELVAQRVAGRVRTEDGLYEGPVWTNGALYFSDFSFAPGYPSRISKLGADGSITTVFEDSGSNGMAVERDGSLVTANHKAGGLVRFNPITGQRTVIVNSYNGAPFNSPNDVAVANDGTIYFTDPTYQHDAALPGQPTTNVYRRATDGTVTIVEAGLEQPNGVTLSPRGDVLYVATAAGAVRAYPIAGGVPGPGRNFLVGLTSPDGMAVDCLGDLYVAEHTEKRVRVFNPAGKQIALIRVDANITNVAFGGNDQRMLYMTGSGAIWKLQMSAPGSVY
jgi:gluconolactonase